MATTATKNRMLAGMKKEAELHAQYYAPRLAAIRGGLERECGIDEEKLAKGLEYLRALMNAIGLFEKAGYDLNRWAWRDAILRMLAEVDQRYEAKKPTPPASFQFDDLITTDDRVRARALGIALD